jgi:hypothetical protein
MAIKIEPQGQQVRTKTQRSRELPTSELGPLFRFDGLNLAKEINPNNSDILNLTKGIVDGLQTIKDEKDNLILKNLETDIATDDEKKIIDVYTSNKNNPAQIYPDIKSWIASTNEKTLTNYGNKYNSDKRFKEKADLILANRERDLLKQTRQHFINEVKRESITEYGNTNKKILNDVSVTTLQGPALLNFIDKSYGKFILNENINPNPAKTAEEIGNFKMVSFITVLKNMTGNETTIYGEVNYEKLLKAAAQDSEGSFIDENNNEIKFEGVIDYINKRFGGNKKDPFFTKENKQKAIEWLQNEASKQLQRDAIKNNVHNFGIAAKVNTLLGEEKYGEAFELINNLDPIDGLRGNPKTVLDFRKSLQGIVTNRQNNEIPSSVSINLAQFIRNKFSGRTNISSSKNSAFTIDDENLIEQINNYLAKKGKAKRFSTKTSTTVFELGELGVLSYSGYESTLNYLKNDPDLKKRVQEASARIQSVIDSKIKTIKGLYSEGNFIVEESLLNMDAALNPLIDEYLLTQKVNGKLIPLNEFLNPASKDFFGGFNFNLYQVDSDRASDAETEFKPTDIEITRARIGQGILANQGVKFNYSNFVNKPTIVEKTPYYKYKKVNAYIKANPGRFQPNFDEIDQTYHWGSVLEIDSGVYEFLKILPKKHPNFDKTVKKYVDEGNSLENAASLARSELYTEDEQEAFRSYEAGIKEELDRGALIVNINGEPHSLYRGILNDAVYNKYKNDFNKDIITNALKLAGNKLRKNIEYDNVYDTELEDNIEFAVLSFRPSEWRKEFKNDKEILDMLEASYKILTGEK